MKYYAVTDDPRELYHYGVKGMKWGQHIFGDKPKSPGYKKAVGKLKSIMGKTAKATKSTAAQVSYNHRQRQDRKFEKAVQKSQKRIAQIEGLHAIDQMQKYERQLNKDQNRVSKQESLAKKAYKAEKQRELNYAKSEAKMDKYLQQAREGKLKYGQLSENQVQRIQQRLQLESNTRRLESAEKTWRQQKKEARRAGYLSGITRGTAAAMEEVARAGATYGIQHLMDRKKLKAKAKFEGKEDRIKNKERNKKSEREWQKEAREELRKEAYKIAIRDPNSDNYNGSFIWDKNLTAANRIKAFKDKEEQKKIEDNRKQLNDNIYTKIMLGGKNADPDKLISNLKRKDEIYDLIYGKDNSKISKLVSGTKERSKISVTDEDIFGNKINKNLNDKIKENALAAVYPAVSAVEKAKRRNAKKRKKQEEAKLKKGQYVHTDDDIWLT